MKVQSGVSLQEKGREVKGPPTKNTKFEDVKKDVTAGVKRGSGETSLNFFHKFDNKFSHDFGFRGFCFILF